MKIFTSLQLVLLLANSIIGYPNGSDEYAEESSEEIIETSTSSTTSTTTITTTIEPLPQISYEVEEIIKKVSTRFKELRSKFLEHQKNVHDKVQMDIKNYKVLRDTSIKIFSDTYDHEIAESNINLKTLEEKKKAIEKSIEKVHDNSWNKEENARKLENLKERNKLLASMKSGDCDNCDGFLDDDQIEAERQKNDNEIAELEEKIHKQGNESEIRIRRLNDEETRQLNTKYLELIYVYQKEVEERKKRDKLELINSIINDKWKNYAGKIGDLHTKVAAKLEELTKKSLKLSKLTSNQTSIDDDLEEFGMIPDLYKWIPFDKSTTVPSDAILGGKDTDGSNLYIIRTKKDDSYLYGKYAVNENRRDTYVTNTESEVTANNFEVCISFATFK